MKVGLLYELSLEELKELYDAELRRHKQLPPRAESATATQTQAAIEDQSEAETVSEET